ncbi:MAG TPA: tRNA (adenosine(37)-N6)-dimethylallyltransferase MiaA [Saprospirales bacterium]|nr:tRNA (adenosine(37)-N6)-dimethylallyltransferase MiaA [Saprospirales bacterium]
MKKLIVIGGATATGKTALAIRVAQWLNTEILSADSRQFYREMNIGTAKPSLSELALVPHHFINSHTISENYSVGAFEKEALELLELRFKQYDHIVLTGGSGLYIQAVCEGFDQFPDVSHNIKSQVEAGIRTGGIEWLQQTLEQLDPQYFSKVDRQNPARLIRAVEVSMEAGKPYSTFLNQVEKRPRFFESVYLLLDLPRPLLYERIDKRVDEMIIAGLEEEARSLIPYRNHPALKTVGYEEFFDYFDGKMSLDHTIEKIKQHSRNYAKRQVTWFNKHGNWNRFLPDEWGKIQSFLTEKLLV